MAHEQDLRIVELILAASGDVNAKDREGRAPLHKLAQSLSPEKAPILQALLAAGAAVSAADSQGKTPLHLAVGTLWSGDFVDALIDAGADLEARDHDGKSARDVAGANEGHFDRAVRESQQRGKRGCGLLSVLSLFTAASLRALGLSRR